MANLRKAFDRALADNEYRTTKNFCETHNINQSTLTKLKSNSPMVTIKKIEMVASFFGMTASEFLKLGE